MHITSLAFIILLRMRLPGGTLPNFNESAAFSAQSQINSADPLLAHVFL